MRPLLSLTALFIVSACSNFEPEVSETPPRVRADDERPGDEDEISDADAGRVDAGAPQGERSIQLATGPVSIVGVTSDGRAVFRDSGTLRVVEIAEPGGTLSGRPDDVIIGNTGGELITDAPGSVLIRGKVVFNWADMDWSENLGDLSVWQSDIGPQHIGPTTYSEGLIAASEAGSIVYPANTLEPTTDLMIAEGDLATPQVLIESMGLGSETTCGARIGFVGERLFVGWCEVDSQVAKLERYERVGDQWQPTLIAADALPAWSADMTGSNVFFQTSDYRAHLADQEGTRLIDSSVSGGFLVPDGTAAFYTVGDQLRRTPLPAVNPFPVVTRGYGQPASFSPGFDFVLYSSVIVYAQGAQRDLRLVATDAFSPTPIELVSTPVATLPRSSFARDGQFVMYLTDVTPSGGSLHVVAIDGNERLVLPGVVDVLAASESTLVFTDNSSDPELYPVLTDLKVIDLATDSAPRLVEAKILDGRSFQLDPSGTKVLYVRSGVDRDPAVAGRDGLFFQLIR